MSENKDEQIPPSDPSPKQNSGDQVNFRGTFRVVKPSWVDESGKEESEELLCITEEIEFTYCVSGGWGNDEWYFDPNFNAALKPLMQEYKSHFEAFHPDLNINVRCMTACIDGVPLDSSSEAFDKARWHTYGNLAGDWENAC